MTQRKLVYRPFSNSFGGFLSDLLVLVLNHGRVAKERPNKALWEPVLMRKPQNSVIDSDSLKSKFLLLKICFLMKYGQNEVVKIWPFHPKKAVIKN